MGTLLAAFRRPAEETEKEKANGPHSSEQDKGNDGIGCYSLHHRVHHGPALPLILLFQPPVFLPRSDALEVEYGIPSARHRASPYRLARLFIAHIVPFRYSAVYARVIGLRPLALAALGKNTNEFVFCSLFASVVQWQNAALIKQRS